jgi:hypothetical protein
MRTLLPRILGLVLVVMAVSASTNRPPFASGYWGFFYVEGTKYLSGGGTQRHLIISNSFGYCAPPIRFWDDLAAEERPIMERMMRDRLGPAARIFFNGSPAYASELAADAGREKLMSRYGGPTDKVELTVYNSGRYTPAAACRP